MFQEITLIRRRGEVVLAACQRNPDGSELLRPVADRAPISYQSWWTACTDRLLRVKPIIESAGPRLLPVGETVPTRKANGCGPAYGGSDRVVTPKDDWGWLPGRYDRRCWKKHRRSQFK